jgi:hypothetical protein
MESSACANLASLCGGDMCVVQENGRLLILSRLAHELATAKRNSLLAEQDVCQSCWNLH